MREYKERKTVQTTKKPGFPLHRNTRRDKVKTPKSRKRRKRPSSRLQKKNQRETKREPMRSSKCYIINIMTVKLKKKAQVN